MDDPRIGELRREIAVLDQKRRNLDVEHAKAAQVIEDERGQISDTIVEIVKAEIGEAATARAKYFALQEGLADRNRRPTQIGDPLKVTLFLGKRLIDDGFNGKLDDAFYQTNFFVERIYPNGAMHLLGQVLIMSGIWAEVRLRIDADGQNADGQSFQSPPSLHYDDLEPHFSATDIGYGWDWGDLVVGYEVPELNSLESEEIPF